MKFIDRQKLKKVEDQVLDLVTIFESLYSTLLKMQQQCKRHCVPERCTDCMCLSIIEDLSEQMDEIKDNLRNVDVLHRRVKGTAHLVSSISKNRNAVNKM